MITRIQLSVNPDNNHLQAIDNVGNEIYLGHNVTTWEFLCKVDPIDKSLNIRTDLYNGCNDVDCYIKIGEWLQYHASFKLGK